jgi:hypothetical protein
MARTGSERFGFDFEPAYRPFLAAFGITPARSWVELNDDELVVRFGSWGLRTPVPNLRDVCVTGPYLAVKAIGLRMSWADRGITFGTTRNRGACVLFREPVEGEGVYVKFHHPGATVTVRDPDAFAAAVRVRIERSA